MRQRQIRRIGIASTLTHPRPDRTPSKHVNPKARPHHVPDSPLLPPVIANGIETVAHQASSTGAVRTLPRRRGAVTESSKSWIRNRCCARVHREAWELVQEARRHVHIHRDSWFSGGRWRKPFIACEGRDGIGASRVCEGGGDWFHGWGSAFGLTWFRRCAMDGGVSEVVSDSCTLRGR